MKQALVKAGAVIIQKVPAPQVSPKNVLVRIHHSCVSAGTEIAGVNNSGLPLYRRALKQREHAKRVFEIMRDQGVKRTLDRVLGMLNAGLPTGYSAAGEVIGIGSELSAFSVGDLVACAGGGIANHAEFIDVPVNLCAKIPSGVSTEVASTVTLGAIALQGVRRANPTLGETIAVIGLGALGQLTAQLLRLNGCRVIGMDINAERVKIAVENGMDFSADPTADDFVEQVHRLTDGFGADAAIITAASSGSSIVSEAMQVCRKKGRVVLVGDVGLDLKRSDFYKKELDFLISCSYGPGRYDATYEEGGQDYPLPWVRWTENRNMEAYLGLLAKGQISIPTLGISKYSIDEAPQAYEALKRGEERSLIVLLEYPERETRPAHTISLRARTASEGKIRVGIAGAGNFAATMHLPNLARLKDRFELHAVLSRTGANARAIADQFGAAYATTDFDQLLSDAAIDLVIIATRHDLHGSMVLSALNAGKDLFVEKPLTLDPADLDQLRVFYETTTNAPLLMTGYNRRFSPAMKRTHEILQTRVAPMMLNYRMNAGYLPPDHWAHSSEGGGRNLGEACHIYDLFNFLTGSRVRAIQATSIAPRGKQYFKNENFVATISYEDGSVCTLTYTALGSKSHPKESMEIFCDGKVMSMIDYKSLTIVGSKQRGWTSLTQQKGHVEEMEALAQTLRNQAEWPISLDHQIEAARIAFEVERQISGG
ncbi:MAG TPA: bi-domain-containing oxidoreductase [Terriglobales bacterium]|nr:bi-domain-containing oxidoreductase [Terriglobales bacterium]